MLDLDDQLTFVIHMQLQELVWAFQCDSSVRFGHLLSAMMLSGMQNLMLGKSCRQV